MSLHPPPVSPMRLRSIIVSLRNSVLQNFKALLSPSVFLLMSVVFGYLLWVVMYQNGSADAMNEAVAAEQFAPGEALRVHYTGIAPIDGVLSILVAFTYPVTSGGDEPSSLLMIEIVSTLQTAQLWAHLDNNRFGRTTDWLKYPAVLFLAVNACGAAVVLPLFFYISLTCPAIEADAYVQLWNAKPLTLSLVLGSILPGLAEITSPIIPRSRSTHQLIIAFMQISPLFMSAIQYVASGLYPIRNIDVRTRKQAYIPSVQQALLVAGIFSALSHIIVIGSTFLGYATLRSIFLPDPSMVSEISGGAKVLEGCRLFLQYDYIGIFLSIVTWCGFMITSLAKVDVFKLMAVLIGSSILVGPGAVACAVLSWREQETLEKREQERQRKIQAALKA